MEKVLGIIVTNYPYGYGESFLKDELEILSGAFDRIYIIIPSFNSLADKQQLFELPANVYVVPIEYKYTTLQKLFTFFRIGPFQFYSELRGALKKYNLPFSFSVFKVINAYLTKEFVFRKQLWRFLSKTGVRKEQLVLYSYWLTEYTFALFKLKKKFPWLEKLGKYTYGFYLIHTISNFVIYNLFQMAGLNGKEDGIFQFLIARPLASLLLTIALGMLSYHFFEKPFLNFKNRFSKIKTS